MANYRIMTDSCCDLTQSMADELNLTVAPLTVNFKGQEFQNFLDGRTLNTKDFYKGLRDGELTSTAAANPSLWAETMKPALEAGDDILVLAFSSGLSTTCNAARIAAEELLETYPDRKIYVVDTLCASMGQGLLCWHAADRKAKGASLEEVRDFCEENKLNLAHWFTVDDLHFLKRGGRISAATAMVGSLLQIKPVLHVDDEGHLISVSKARGRKAAIQALAAKVGEDAFAPEDQVMFISHGDCLEDAEHLASILKETYHVPEVCISYVGPVIGSHSGPGTLALFYLGKKR